MQLGADTLVRGAGFSRIRLEVLTRPDMEGRLLGMIRTVAGYARESRGGSTPRLIQSTGTWPTAPSLP
jgi:hypothetical protein